MFRKIFSLLLCLFVLPSMVSAETIVIDLTRKKTKNALVRSILLPGWGQFFQGKKTKGYIIAIGAFVSAATAYYYCSEAQKSYDKYKTTGLIADGSYSDYQNKNNDAQYALISLALFWVYGIFDTTYSVPYPEKWAKNDSKKDGFKLAFDKGNLRLLYKRHFDFF